jgi:hypothetical protein
MYPWRVDPRETGLELFFPSRWNSNGSDPVCESPLRVQGVGFRASRLLVKDWGDWTLAFRLPQSDHEFLDVTVGEGMPIVWVEPQGVQVALDAGRDAQFLQAGGGAVQFPFTGDRLVIASAGRMYGVFVPPKTRFSPDGPSLHLQFPAGKSFVAVAAMQQARDLATCYLCAYAIPRDSRVDWSYDARRGTVATTWTVIGAVVLGSPAAPAADTARPPEWDRLVGQPADIAPSAYQYRADRQPEENAPESWLAVMRYAGRPLNKPVDVQAPAIKQALCALLWEEIRPVRQLELTWPADAKNRPAPEELVVTTLDQQGSASSWWNNLKAVKKPVAATVSASGNTYLYDLHTDTCGLVISIGGTKVAAEYAVPAVRVLVADTWKSMDFEIEWGYEPSRAEQDYTGRIEVYDGMVTRVSPLAGDTTTQATGSAAWRSAGQGGPRRGVKASLLFMGTSKWRRVYPFTSQADDVARTIVTVWTRAGNFSFLAADLEHGPILAPEYGFFVRRVSDVAGGASVSPTDPPMSMKLLAAKMSSIAGSRELQGWGSDECPWFGGNPSDRPVSVKGITIPARSVAMHPGSDRDVAVGWRSPIQGTVRVQASVAHAQAGSNGIEWWIVRESPQERKTLAHGATDGKGSRRITADERAKELAGVAVAPQDTISLVVGPQGAHHCDTTIIELVLAEAGQRGRVWNLTQDVIGTLHAGNPHADGQGHTGVWRFCDRPSASTPAPSEPPIDLASQAAGAREFIEELRGRNLSTIRQRIRAREEQTWEGAVTAMRGANLPPHPSPPTGFTPRMQVQVPCERLTAQWNLGAWHLVRHAQKHPVTGRLWFNDHPYGILAAETYMILAALDLMGSHQAAEDGFDQWVSLPLDPIANPSLGHHAWALSDRPNGLFSEGHGCLTHAVGPPGAGGHMDGVHAFGPGSIGWALVEHYRLTGDKAWFQAAAPRIQANVEWILRQRRVVQDMVPGGRRLWCRGLQPAQQVTPDSGGLWMQFYECEAYYWAAVAHFADALATIDPAAGARLQAEAAAYRQDLLAAVERTMALSPVVPVRDGTYHSVIPFACYVRGLSTGAWGWQRDGSGRHVGPMYWETVQSAAPLISPARLLSPDDVRVQGYLDVLEDRLLLENPNVAPHDWFAAGWQYQGGLERTANVHLAADDIPAFLRSFLNCYAIDILPGQGYIFREHATGGPPDKIFEEAAFLERFRHALVREDGDTLWLAQATPRAWLAQGQRIAVRNAPTYFGTLAYEIVSDADRGRINATVELPSRTVPPSVLLRLRHPQATPIKAVTVNGKDWSAFNKDWETVELRGLTGTVAVTARY